MSIPILISPAIAGLRVVSPDKSTVVYTMEDTDYRGHPLVKIWQAKLNKKGQVINSSRRQCLPIFSCLHQHLPGERPCRESSEINAIPLLVYAPDGKHIALCFVTHYPDFRVHFGIADADFSYIASVWYNDVGDFVDKIWWRDNRTCTGLVEKTFSIGEYRLDRYPKILRMDTIIARSKKLLIAARQKTPFEKVAGWFSQSLQREEAIRTWKKLIDKAPQINPLALTTIPHSVELGNINELTVTFVFTEDLLVEWIVTSDELNQLPAGLEQEER